MASYLPPTDSLPIFDNTVFDSNNTTALTYATAKSLFVTYPSAQGSSTITDFIAGTINYLSPSSGSFFNIGTNQVSGGTIRIGPTGVSGVSVHAGNIDCTNNTINNATDSALNNISLGNLQTSGVLNIGTGTRTTGGNTGAINIGTGDNVTAAINIGGGVSSSGSINIGHQGTTTGTTTTNINTSTTGSHPVNIGSSTSLTTINGASTLTGAVTISLPLTLPATWTTPTSTQLGYVNNVTLPSGTGPYAIGTINSATQIHTLNIPIGTYIVTYTASYSVVANYTMSFTLGSPTMFAKYCNTVLTTAAAAANNNIKINMSCIIQNTVSQQWYLAHQATVLGNATDVYLSYVRIA
jgi:hypothetical protein